jgi:hypothetical protein
VRSLGAESVLCMCSNCQELAWLSGPSETVLASTRLMMACWPLTQGQE